MTKKVVKKTVTKTGKTPAKKEGVKKAAKTETKAPVKTAVKKETKTVKPVKPAPVANESRRPKDLTVDEWKTIAALPTLAAAMKETGFYSPTINKYLAQNGIKTNWKPGRPKMPKAG